MAVLARDDQRSSSRKRAEDFQHVGIETYRDIQEMCDFYFYQQKNIVDNRKYSHGVAESNLMEISLNHLKVQYSSLKQLYTKLLFYSK